MSNIRQSENDLLVRTLGLKLSNGHVIDGHAHSWGQIIFASRGVMQVDAEGSRWAVPPMRCLWVPSDIDHRIRIVAETWMRTIYLRPDLANGLPLNCKVLNVSPLLREVILETVRLKMLSQAVTTHKHLAAVLIDQLVAADEMSLKIMMPADARAARLANLISSDPANKSPLDELARLAGASPRTLERLFVDETGLSVGRWRQQARLMMAIRLLVEGNSVNQAAFESGYENPSSFVAMFRREMGITPGQYLRGTETE
jgi:AraC-like DNA-binding protein